MVANAGSTDPVFLTPGFFTAAIGSDNMNPFEQSFGNSADADEDFLNTGPKNVSGVSTPGNGFGSNAPFKPISPPTTTSDFLETGGTNNMFGPYFYPHQATKPLTPPFNSLSPNDQPLESRQPDDLFSGVDLQSSLNKLETQVDSSNTRIQNGIVTPVSARSPESREGVSQPQREPEEEARDTICISVPKKAKPSSGNTSGASTAKKPRKRIRKPRNARFGDSTNRDDEKLAKFRERNRLAASKCREKKKAWTSNLESRVRELQAGKETLSILAHSMKEELNYLQEELLKHGDCSFEPINRYLQKAAERSFSPTRYSRSPQHSRNGSMASDASFYNSLTDDRGGLNKPRQVVDSVDGSQIESNDDPFNLAGEETFESLISNPMSQDDSGGTTVKSEQVAMV